MSMNTTNKCIVRCSSMKHNNGTYYRWLISNKNLYYFNTQQHLILPLFTIIWQSVRALEKHPEVSHAKINMLAHTQPKNLITRIQWLFAFVTDFVTEKKVSRFSNQWGNSKQKVTGQCQKETLNNIRFVIACKSNCITNK